MECWCKKSRHPLAYYYLTGHPDLLIFADLMKKSRHLPMAAKG